MKRIALALLLFLAPFSAAHATVNEVIARNDFVGNASSTVFTYTFKTLAKTDIQVLINGVEQAVDSAYLVGGLGDSAGGTITFFTPPAAGVRVTFLRKQPISQLSQYTANEAFPATRVGTDFDKQAMVDQMQNEQIGRSLKFEPKSLFKDIFVPDPVGGQCLAWNSTATGMANVVCGSGGGGGGSALVSGTPGQIVATTGAGGTVLSFPVTGVLMGQNVTPAGSSFNTSATFSSQATTSATDLRQFAGSFSLTSNQGFSHTGVNIQKTTLFAGLSALAGTGDVRGLNVSTRMETGSGTYNAFGGDFVLFNTNADRGNSDGSAGMGSPIALGISVFSSGSSRSTAAISVNSVGNLWNRGIVVSETAVAPSGSSFQDLGSPARSVDIRGNPGFGIHQGTAGVRNLLAGGVILGPVAPGALPAFGNQGRIISVTDNTLRFDTGSAWVTIGTGGSGTGTVTNTLGPLTANSFILGAGGSDVKSQAITGIVIGQGANPPTAYAGFTCAAGQFVSGVGASGGGTCTTPAGAGTVTNSGALTLNAVIIGAGATAVSATAVGPIHTVFAGTGAAPVFTAIPQVTGVITTGQEAIGIHPWGPSSGQTSEIRFWDLFLGGANYVGFKAPNAIVTSRIWTLPSADGTAGQMLTWNSGGILTWTTPPGSGGGAITGAGVAGQVSYWTGTATIAGSPAFLWDAVNDQFTVNTLSSLIDGSSWAVSSARFGRDMPTAVNEFAVNIQARVSANTGAVTNYEKAALIVMARTNDPSGATTRDMVGIDTRGEIASTNAQGRAWGLYTESGIQSGGDGLAIGAEITIRNLGTDQPIVGTTTSKYNMHVVAVGPATAAMYINAPVGAAFHKGIYAVPGSFFTGATDSFIELLGAFTVRPDGATSIGPGGTGIITTPLSVTQSIGGSGTIARLEATTANAGAARSVLTLVRSMTALQMTDGFGVRQDFVLRDADAVDNIVSRLIVARSGADSTGIMDWQTAIAGSLATRFGVDVTGNFYAVGVAKFKAGGAVGEIRLNGTGDTTYAGLKAPAVGPNLSWTLPVADGTTGQSIVTDGAGNLSFASGSYTGGTYSPTFGGTGVRVLTTGSTVIPAVATGFRLGNWSFFDTKTDNVDNALIQMNVVQTSNPACSPPSPSGIGPGCAPLRKTALSIYQYSQPDNGHDSSAVTIVQTGGGNALSAFRLTGSAIRPGGYTDFSDSTGYAAEFGTGANWYAVGIFVGPPQGETYGPSIWAGGLLVNLRDHTNVNLSGRGVLINPQNVIFDGREAYAVGSPVSTGVPSPTQNVHYQVLLNGNTGFGGPAINSTVTQLAVYSSDAAGANVLLKGNGVNPDKTIRAAGGELQVVSHGYSAVILQLTNAGQLRLPALATGVGRQLCLDASGFITTVAAGTACPA